MSFSSLIPDSSQVEVTSVDKAMLQDHRHVESCYDQFLAETDVNEKQKYANQLIKSIPSTHSARSRLFTPTSQRSKEQKERKQAKAEVKLSCLFVCH